VVEKVGQYYGGVILMPAHLSKLTDAVLFLGIGKRSICLGAPWIVLLVNDWGVCHYPRGQKK
jgi:hypothetical protein